MKLQLQLIAALLVATTPLSAQKTLPVIRANSDQVDIRDGDEYRQETWTITPKLKPDIYETAAKKKKLTFYTDLDSITFKIKPGVTYDFIILLNGKDSALTRIVTVPEIPSYLSVLKNADKFNFKDTRPLPEFSYQSADNPHLVALRKAFNLDSIAGTGNEVSKILNLLHWIHNLVPHDGQHGNPEVKNAMNMIAECKRDQRGLNCRGLATVLNECYLSMGIKSRFVTCLPKDTADVDCHVINMVYSTELDKWLWIDPTNDAYVMDETGTLLSVEEVRERLVTGKPLILNPDANWNRRASTGKEFYLYQYMAKNLYRFECPVSSEYDTETKAEGKSITYVQLMPLDYFDQKPDKTERISQFSGMKIVEYKTNNPAAFWKKP